jgi:hypothetical protein
MLPKADSAVQLPFYSAVFIADRTAWVEIAAQFAGNSLKCLADRRSP